MSLQTTVNTKLGFGIVGSFYDDSPRRVSPKVISGTSAGSIACAYTIDATDPSKCVLGGSGVFGGIAVNSKEYATAGLSASLDFKVGQIAELCTMGHIILKIAGTVSVGDAAYFDTTTGAISAAESGETISGKTEIAGSKFIEVSASSTEPVCVLQLG